MADVFLRAGEQVHALGERHGELAGTLGLAAVWAGAAADFTAETVADASAAQVCDEIAEEVMGENSSPSPLYLELRRRHLLMPVVSGRFARELEACGKGVDEAGRALERTLSHYGRLFSHGHRRASASPDDVAEAGSGGGGLRCNGQYGLAAKNPVRARWASAVVAAAAVLHELEVVEDRLCSPAAARIPAAGLDVYAQAMTAACDAADGVYRQACAAAAKARFMPLLLTLPPGYWTAKVVYLWMRTLTAAGCTTERESALRGLEPQWPDVVAWVRELDSQQAG
jgi:hypothetical protein